MTVHVFHILTAILIACLAWYANEQLSPPPILKIVRVLIVVVFCLFLLSDLGLLGTRMQIS